MARPIDSLVTPSTLQFIKEQYYIGPPASIVPRLFPVELLHREGYIVCCHAAVVCRYDGNGDLAEAWGCLKCHKGQCVQNAMLTEWPMLENGDLEALGHMVKVCA